MPRARRAKKRTSKQTKKRVGKTRSKPAKKAPRPGARVVRRKATPRSGLRLKPRPKKESSRIQRLRAMLLAKQAEIVEKIKRARADAQESDRTSFPEVGDLVSASVEKEKAFEYGEIGMNALREISTALEKLKGGTYGVCEACSKPIGVKRLEAVPSARLCVKCKATEEASPKSPPLSAEKAFDD